MSWRKKKHNKKIFKRLIKLVTILVESTNIRGKYWTLLHFVCCQEKVMNVYFGILFNEPSIFSSNQHRQRGNSGEECKLKREE